jgi:hypothetical protein
MPFLCRLINITIDPILALLSRESIQYASTCFCLRLWRWLLAVVEKEVKKREEVEEMNEAAEVEELEEKREPEDADTDVDADAKADVGEVNA